VSARTIRILAIGYAVKSLLIGLAWLAVPDLPERAANTARGAWEWAVSRSAR
jgi:hypothetical protein